MMRSLGLIILGVAVFIGLQSVYTVNEREQALIVYLGNPVDSVNENGEDAGLHFKMPFVMNVLIFDRRNLEFDMSPEEIQASDQVRLVVDAFLRYRITNPLRFYQTVRDERGAQLRLRSIMDDSLRGVIASIPSQDVISGQRAELMERVQAAVEAQVATQDLGIEVVDVRILRADLPQQIAERVFERMRSQRELERNRILAEGERQATEIRANADREVAITLAEARADSQRIRGEGDAQRTAIYAAAYGRDAEFYGFYRSMEAYEVAIQNGTPIVIPPDSEFFEYFRSQSGQ
ncbi:MAG: protease modulator HflC [Maricaulis sp.]|uniref:protease modulator HflC n=1 Tax=Maricaulis sp. TaxID=1486257 RepID=UPI001B221EF1|nr:protease modulator HflC [Maricaulis sp.]MBO6729739.1 protease modulator HflC [Maricaulis sp.]MBO6847184.1 protease modulator HflC [Maricaulis sp.]MBO6876842.1 protease modulator HflC [Maricaulis sp.]